MIKIGIVEDNQLEADRLIKCLSLYEKEYGNDKVKFDIHVYNDSKPFIESINSDVIHDIIFFDIELPTANGMDIATEFRTNNRETPIIFVTNLTQYAIKGYKVDALDYILKPIEYNAVIEPLRKALTIVKNNTEEMLVVKNGTELTKISSKDLMYIEIRDHKLSYHTTKETLTGYGTLSDLELRLKNHYFLRSNNCYLVNPKYIKKIEGDMIQIKNDDLLKISRPRKKKFLSDLTDWLGEGNII